jgi:hypothetical protein
MDRPWETVHDDRSLTEDALFVLRFTRVEFGHGVLHRLPRSLDLRFVWIRHVDRRLA